MNIITENNKHYITIPFSLKDELKKAIPSAKWDKFKKQWFVGARSKKKLQDWIDSTKDKLETTEREAKEKKDALMKSLEQMKPILGNTYHIKDKLKEDFSALFYNGEWYTDSEKHNEAQTFVDNYNSLRVTRKSADETEDSLSKKLTLIEKILCNFDEYGKEYLQDDDFSKMIHFSHLPTSDAYEILRGINKDLFFSSQEADIETDFPFSFDYEDSENILEFLGLSKHYCFDASIQDSLSGSVDIKILSFEEIESSLIRKMLTEKSFHYASLDEVSKKVEGVGGFKPTFHYLSKITGKLYPATSSITEENSSSRVTVYSAKNIPILHSDNFITVVNYWWNKARQKEVKA